ncbi:MAG: PhoH family protein [Planctomycetota bacterium]|nr:PhoH family protein [Planctomycetota bacterium]
MPKERISDAGESVQRALFGPMDRHLRLLRERFGVRITARDDVLTLDGSDDAAVQDVMQRVKRVLARLERRGEPEPAEVEDLLLGEGRFDERKPKRESSPAKARGAQGGRSTRTPQAGRATGGARGAQLGRMSGGSASRSMGGPGAGYDGPRPQRTEPRSEGQRQYLEAIRKYDIVFAVGPAGTGKTYLAVVEAVEALRSGAVRRIVLTRPAVEAGEKLGFLPGDFHAKINPYLRPLYDALGDLIPWGEVQRYVDADVIEIVPLAYMRGRTLKNAFIILDEAQNTTPAQMKMFLTRLGDGSKAVVNGDTTQLDLPEGTPSGLVESIRILDGVNDLAVIRFGPHDIQRHPLVQRIVDAYDREDERNPPETGRRSRK